MRLATGEPLGDNPILLRHIRTDASGRRASDLRCLGSTAASSSETTYQGQTLALGKAEDPDSGPHSAAD